MPEKGELPKTIAMSDFNLEGNCGNDDNNLQSDAGQLQLSIAVSRQTSDLKCPLAFAVNFREKNNISEINGQIGYLCISNSARINNIVIKISEQEDNFRDRWIKFRLAIFLSISSEGYSLEADVDDIIDNSIAANANRVDIYFFPKDGSYTPFLIMERE